MARSLWPPRRLSAIRTLATRNLGLSHSWKPKPAASGPTLAAIGSRVYLRKHDHTDLGRFVSWYMDPEIADLLRHDLSPLTPIQARGYFESIVMPASHRGLCWAIVEVATDRLIGSTALVDLEGDRGSALFRIVIGEKDAWNQGFGTEATGLVLGQAFQRLGRDRVNLEVFSHNPRAQKAYIRAGFQRTGQHSEWVSRAHRQIDVVEMSITRDQWLEAAGDSTPGP